MIEITQEAEEERMGAAVVSHGRTPPVLDPGERALYPVPLPVKGFVIQDGVLRMLPVRDAGDDAAFAETCGPRRRGAISSPRRPSGRRTAHVRVFFHLLVWERY